MLNPLNSKGPLLIAVYGLIDEVIFIVIHQNYGIKIFLNKKSFA
jgi:hypothetical protein